MGGCGSTEGAASPEARAAARRYYTTNAVVDKVVRTRLVQETTVKKLLLLGTGDSGKSTVFKQMIRLYGKGFAKESRAAFRGPIFDNVSKSLYTLAKHAGLEEDSDFKEDLPKLKALAETAMPNLTAYDGDVIKRIWMDDRVKAAYDNRSELQIPDSVEYFLEKIEEITDMEWIPSEEDLLRARVKTLGIHRENFEIDQLKFQMIDVGGQRNERKKWIHCFEGVTAVIFITAISEYDQKCHEDNITNRVEESLNLFNEMVNSEWFKKTEMILFLNKRDLFDKKFEKIPLKTYFSDFEGSTVDDGYAFFGKKFTSLCKSSKYIFTHVTVATDKDNIFLVFNAVKNIIFTENMQALGVL